MVADIIHALEPSSLLSEERIAELLSEKRNDLKPKELAEVVGRIAEDPQLQQYLGGPARDHVFEQIAAKDDVRVPREALNNVVDVLCHEPVRGVVLQLALVFAARQLPSPQDVKEHRVRVKILLEMLRQLRRILRVQEYSSKADIDNLHTHEDIKRLIDGFDLLCLDGPPDIQLGDEESHDHAEDVDEPVPETASSFSAVVGSIAE